MLTFAVHVAHHFLTSLGVKELLKPEVIRAYDNYADIIKTDATRDNAIEAIKAASNKEEAFREQARRQGKLPERLMKSEKQPAKKFVTSPKLEKLKFCNVPTLGGGAKKGRPSWQSFRRCSTHFEKKYIWPPKSALHESAGGSWNGGATCFCAGTATRVLLEMLKDRGHPTDPELFESEVDPDMLPARGERVLGPRHGVCVRGAAPREGTPTTVCFSKQGSLSLKDLRELLEKLDNGRLLLVVEQALKRPWPRKPRP